MKIVVLGAGLVGAPMAIDLNQEEQFAVTVVDYNREALAIDVDLSMPSLRVIRSLEQVIEWRGKPAAIRCDNGPGGVWDPKRGDIP